MTATELTAPTSVPREDNEWRRPLIIPPGGGRPVPYSRFTKWIDVIEDRYLLELYGQRKVIAGLTERPDLLLSAAAHRDDRDRLNQIAKDAQAAAKADAAAIIGTAVHKLAELHDRGQPVGTIPGDYQRDLDAYVAATACLTHIHVEQFMVLDRLKIGGTPDRISTFEGGMYIADLKTGNSDNQGRLAYGLLKIAMQLAVAAHADLYNPATGGRTPVAVDQNNAIIIHVPAGTGRCELHWVNIARGWQAVQTAIAVREWRKVKGLTAPLNVPAPSGAG